MKKVYEINVRVEGKAEWSGSGWRRWPVYGYVECYVIAESEEEARRKVIEYDYYDEFGEIWDEIGSVTIMDIATHEDATATDEDEYIVTDTGLSDDSPFDNSDDIYEMRKLSDF